MAEKLEGKKTNTDRVGEVDRKKRQKAGSSKWKGSRVVFLTCTNHSQHIKCALLQRRHSVLIGAKKQRGEK